MVITSSHHQLLINESQLTFLYEINKYIYIPKDAKPMYQVLSAKDGYIPVYIRVGDTPLDDINPALASAFHETVLGRNIGKDVAAVSIRQ